MRIDFPLHLGRNGVMKVTICRETRPRSGNLSSLSRKEREFW